MKKIGVTCFLAFLLLVNGCTQIQNSLIIPSNTAIDITFENLKVWTLNSEKEGYKDIKIEFTMQNSGSRKTETTFYYELEVDKGYFYEPLCLSPLCSQPQPTGLLPEESHSGQIGFRILSSSEPKYLLLYDGSINLKDVEQALVTGKEPEKKMLGKIDLTDKMLPINYCETNKDCNSNSKCYLSKNTCVAKNYCETDNICNLPSEYCNPQNRCESIILSETEIGIGKITEFKSDKNRIIVTFDEARIKKTISRINKDSNKTEYFLMPITGEIINNWEMSGDYKLTLDAIIDENNLCSDKFPTYLQGKARDSPPNTKRFNLLKDCPAIPTNSNTQDKITLKIKGTISGTYIEKEEFEKNIEAKKSQEGLIENTEITFELIN